MFLLHGEENQNFNLDDNLEENFEDESLQQYQGFTSSDFKTNHYGNMFMFVQNVAPDMMVKRRMKKEAAIPYWC